MRIRIVIWEPLTKEWQYEPRSESFELEVARVPVQGDLVSLADRVAEVVLVVLHPLGQFHVASAYVRLLHGVESTAKERVTS